jgi:hypothetical protein
MRPQSEPVQQIRPKTAKFPRSQPIESPHGEGYSEMLTLDLQTDHRDAPPSGSDALALDESIRFRLANRTRHRIE